MDCKFSKIKICQLKNSTFQSQLLNFGDFDISGHAFTAIFMSNKIKQSKQLFPIGNTLKIPFSILESEFGNTRVELWWEKDGIKDIAVAFDVKIVSENCKECGNETQHDVIVEINEGQNQIPVSVTQSIVNNLLDFDNLTEAQKAELKGKQGDKGEQGEQGIQGTQGDKGDKGDKGEQGIQGAKGDTGVKGDKGDQGEKGDKGEKGDAGEKGAQGEKGEKGDAGEKGDKGDNGDIGEKGDKCDAFTYADIIRLFRTAAGNWMVKRMDKLKPCPFCGGEAVLKQISDRWTVHCSQHCAGTRIFNDKQKPIDAWNRRVDARQLALKTRVCPMCEDCPDGCPVETPKDSRNIVTNADRIRSVS